MNGVFEYQWKAPSRCPRRAATATGPTWARWICSRRNPAPVFQTQVALGSTSPFTFAVLGDWGQADAAGANPYQAGVMSQIENSGARFAITTGDQGYPSGGQNEYGDLQIADRRHLRCAVLGWCRQHASDLRCDRQSRLRPQRRGPSAVRELATRCGGGHLRRARPDGRVRQRERHHTRQPTRATGMRSLPAMPASTSSTAAWADHNFGTGTVYGADYLSHWTTTSPEYQWLQADLIAHPSGLKFAFFHYPLYSDQPDENSDTLPPGEHQPRGPSRLEWREHRVQRPRPHLPAQLRGDRARPPEPGQLRHRRRRRHRAVARDLQRE